MSSEHKRPLYAFVVLTLVCGVFMGYSVKAQALMDVLRNEATILASEATRIGPVMTIVGRDSSSVATLTASSSVDSAARVQDVRPRPVVAPTSKADAAELHQDPVAVRSVSARASMRSATVPGSRSHEGVAKAQAAGHTEDRFQGHAKGHSKDSVRGLAKGHTKGKARGLARGHQRS